jgi:hypothetical protein
VSVFDLLGEGLTSRVSVILELGRLAAKRARARARRVTSPMRREMFEGLGAEPDLADARAALNQVPAVTTGGLRRRAGGRRRRRW